MQATDPRQRARRARGVLRRAEGGRMSELSPLTIAEARDRLRAGEITAVELTEACLAEIEAAGALNAFSALTPEIARDAGARRRMRGWRRATRPTCAASRSGSRICSAPKACRRRPRRASSRASARPTRAPSPRQLFERGRGDARQAQHGRVRHGLVERDLGLRPVREPVAARRATRRR